MSDEDGFSGVFHRLQDWEECGRRLMQIAKEVKEKVGETPLLFNDEGEVFLHPDLARKLNEPGNEGPLEFLKYLKRTGITKP